MSPVRNLKVCTIRSQEKLTAPIRSVDCGQIGNEFIAAAVECRERKSIDIERVYREMIGAVVEGEEKVM